LLLVLGSLGCSTTTRYTPPGDGGTAGSAGEPSTGGSGGTATGGGTNGGSAGAGGGTASTWCDTQAVPVGVAATDYSCVDFDTGMPAETVWAPAISSTGALELTNEIAASTPQSLRVSEAPPDPGTVTVLKWQVAGSDSITSVSVSAEINPSGFGGVSPPWAAGYSLLCVENATSFVCLNYTRGATIDGSNPYTGYYLTFAYFGSAAFLQNCPITPVLDFNVWTSVELVASTSQNEVRFNDIGVGTCGTIDTASAVEVRVGLDKGYGSVSPWQVAFDNVVATVTR
jgi:hypothetical protein